MQYISQFLSKDFDPEAEWPEEKNTKLVGRKWKEFLQDHGAELCALTSPTYYIFSPSLFFGPSIRRTSVPH
jgi:hypothetical protein